MAEVGGEVLSSSPISMPASGPTATVAERVDAHHAVSRNIIFEPVVGFLCCDVNHSIAPSPIMEAAESSFTFETNQILDSLRYDSQTCSAIFRIVSSSDESELRLVFRNIIGLSSFEEVQLVQSVLLFQIGKYASTNFLAKPLSYASEVACITSPRIWNIRNAAEKFNISRVSDKSLFKAQLEKTSNFGKNIFSLLNWYHVSNSVERKGFLCGLIAHLAMKSCRIFNEIVAASRHRDFILQLPNDISKTIIRLLDARSLGRLGMGNHAYYSQVKKCRNDQKVGKSAALRLIDIENPMSNVPTYQRAYIEVESQKNLRTGDSKLIELDGHERRVLCVTVWRTMVATGSADQTVRIWSLSNGKCLQVLEGHKAGVWCVQFFTKHIVVSASYDGSIRIWLIRQGRCLRELRGHAGPVWSIKIDGNLMISGSQDKIAVLWDAVRGEPLLRLSGHRHAIFAVDICIQDALALTGSADRSIRLWSTHDGQLLKSIPVHTGYSITSIAYHRNYLAVASNLSVRLFHIDVIKQAAGQTHIHVSNHPIDFEEEHQKRIECVFLKISNPNRMTPEGVLVTGSKDGLIKYWDFAQPKSQRSFKPLGGRAISCVYFDAYRVACAGDTGKTCVYDFVPVLSSPKSKKKQATQAASGLNTRQGTIVSFGKATAASVVATDNGTGPGTRQNTILSGVDGIGDPSHHSE